MGINKTFPIGLNVNKKKKFIYKASDITNIAISLLLRVI